MPFAPLNSTDQATMQGSSLVDQIVAAIEAAGIQIEYGRDGYRVTDVNGASAIINGGSGGWLAVAKTIKQAELDAFLNDHFDLLAFIRGGSNASVTGNNVSTFLANITNNYRSIRASISAQTTVAGVASIGVTSGWPNNP